MEKSLFFPNVLPVKYANVSLVQTIINTPNKRLELKVDFHQIKSLKK